MPPKKIAILPSQISRLPKTPSMVSQLVALHFIHFSTKGMLQLQGNLIMLKKENQI